MTRVIELKYAQLVVHEWGCDTGNFTVSGASVSLAANQDFPASTGTGTTLTHWSIGNSAGTILYYGAIATPFVIDAANKQPRVNAGTVVTEA